MREDSFLHIAMDGVDVNWDVPNKLENILVEDGFSETLNIGSCVSMLFIELSKLDQVIQGGI